MPSLLLTLGQQLRHTYRRSFTQELEQRGGLPADIIHDYTRGYIRLPDGPPGPMATAEKAGANTAKPAAKAAAKAKAKAVAAAAKEVAKAAAKASKEESRASKEQARAEAKAGKLAAANLRKRRAEDDFCFLCGHGGGLLLFKMNP